MMDHLKTSSFCTVTDERLEISKYFQILSEFEHGAMNWFVGRVRKTNHGRSVVQVNYDCHPHLSQKVFEEIVREASESWAEDLRAVVIHRSGELKIGEISVLIGVSTRHRAEAFLASRYIIEQIKLRAPIWKQEIYKDGQSEWLKGHSLCGH